MRTLVKLVILVLLYSSCKELEDPISSTSDKVFYLQGKINGNDLYFAGGDSLNYHFTSYKKDERNVYEYISEFKNGSCATCDDQLKITIRAHEQSNSGTPSINDVLGKINYDYLSNIALPRHRTFKFNLDTTKVPIGSSTSVLWEFGDGTTSNELSPVHFYKEDGVKQVTLNFSNSFCINKVVKEVHATPDSFPSICISDFSYTINASQVTFSAIDTALVTSFLWDFGDGNTSTLPNPTHNYSAAASYVITLTVKKNTLSCEYTVSKQMNMVQGNCEVNFNFRAEPPPTSSDTLNLSKVLVEYTSKNGDYYRSDLIEQANAEFVITDVEPYFNNEKNDKTIRFSLKLSCELMNNSGNTILIEQGTGKIAVAYP